MTEVSVDGWTIYLHPLCRAQLRSMIESVQEAGAADPENDTSRRCTKLLAATRKMAFEEIPGNPADPRFRLR